MKKSFGPQNVNILILKLEKIVLKYKENSFIISKIDRNQII